MNNEIRNLITQFLQKKFPDIEILWDALPETKKFDFYRDLLKLIASSPPQPDDANLNSDLEHRLNQLIDDEHPNST